MFKYTFDQVKDPIIIYKLKDTIMCTESYTLLLTFTLISVVQKYFFWHCPQLFVNIEVLVRCWYFTNLT